MHTVAEVGFWDDPRTLAFCAKVKNPDAGAWVLRLREFILTMGENDGRLPGYSSDQIVAKLKPTCPPATLFRALADNHYLLRRKRTFYYPEWKKTQMGKYCQDREWDRQRKLELRQATHVARMAELTGQVAKEKRTSTGRPPDIQRNSGVSKHGRPPDVPPGPPGAPRRGASVNATRWEWFKQNHPKIQDPERCQQLLGELTPEEWEHLCYALPKQAAKYRGDISPRWCPGAPRYLREKRFLEIRLPTPEEKKAAEKAKKKAATPEKEPTLEEKKAAAWEFLRQYLDDPWPEREKDVRKADHFKQWGEKPWEEAATTAGSPRARAKARG
jgi:hypothetical protein